MERELNPRLVLFAQGPMGFCLYSFRRNNATLIDDTDGEFCGYKYKSAKPARRR